MWGSPPSRRRGLKFRYKTILSQAAWVASFAEAWIEIFFAPFARIRAYSRLLRGGVDWNSALSGSHCVAFRSPPSRRRGLKYKENKNILTKMSSPPSRRRGLKYMQPAVLISKSSRLLRGGVDWNIRIQSILLACIQSPPSRRRGLKFCESINLICLRCRLLRGGVDWNVELLEQLSEADKVASFAEAWIEISYISHFLSEEIVAFFAEA